MNNILIRPIITEQSLKEATLGRFTFEVAKEAKKPEILLAVASQFNVHPVAVKTAIKKGSLTRNRRTRILTRKPDCKKAIVALLPGEKIDLFETGGTENA